MKNILLLSAGRRVGLLRAFEESAALLRADVQIIATDMNPGQSVACSLASFTAELPRVDDDLYIKSLSELCDRHEIGIIVPTIDTELLILAQHRDHFAEMMTHAVVSDSTLVDIFDDKRTTEIFLCEMGFKTPKIQPKLSPEFPLYVKPTSGSNSNYGYVAWSKPDLMLRDIEDPDIFFVEYCDPRSYAEYTVDLYYSQHGNLECAVARRRLSVKGGEVEKALLERPAFLAEIEKNLNHVPGMRGCITLQGFCHLENQTFLVNEVNPRFGGGYTMSFAAGANYPRALIEEYLLESAPSNNCWNWVPDRTYGRYDVDVCLSNV